MFSVLKREILLSNGQVFELDKYNYYLKYYISKILLQHCLILHTYMYVGVPCKLT